MATEAPLNFSNIYPVAIIGTGFGGLCAAIKLLEMGQRDFVIFERAGSVGGTWRDNSYPGCACDVPAALYSFSFEQNADWSRVYPTQAELYAYLKRVSEKYGVMPFVRFHHEVQRSVFDEEANIWRLETNAGTYQARVIISAIGGLAEPATPALPGQDSFTGVQFHSARWDHEFNLHGKRVAVIGSAASAIQVVPAIAPQVARLDVYQRTPSWVMPRRDRAVSPLMKRLRRTPLKWLFRWALYVRNEIFAYLLVKRPGLLHMISRLGKRHIRMSMSEPELQAKVMPNYVMGCKRILTSDDWYPALMRENVNVVTEPIREITERGLVTCDGIERGVDAIVCCTGFHATDNPIAGRVVGRNGMSLADHWTEGEEAYLGTVVHGFPNFFFITGPNTGIGHTSLVFMIEAQVRYITSCLREMKRRGATVVEVRPETQRIFNERLQARMHNTVWMSGCKSWYQHKSGKITTLWPDFTFRFWWLLRRMREEDFQIS